MNFRQLVVRFVVPVVALGAMVMACAPARVQAAEAGMQVAAATSRQKTMPRPRVSRPATPAPAPARPAAPTDDTDKIRREIAPDASWGQVSGTNVNIRTGAGTQNGIVTTLKGGEYVHARATQGGWTEIDWPKNVPMWAPRESFTSAEANGVRTITAKVEAPLRMQGTRQAPAMVKLAKGQSVTVIAEVNGWYKVQAPENARAFISSKYVLMGVQAPTPVASAAANKLISSVPSRAEAAAIKPATVESAPAKVATAAPAPVAPAAPSAPITPAAPVAPAAQTTEKALAPSTVSAPVATAPVIETTPESAAKVVEAEPAAPAAVPEVTKSDLISDVEATRRRLLDAPAIAPIVHDEPKLPAMTPVLLDEPETAKIDREAESLAAEHQKLLKERTELEETQRKLADEAKKIDELETARLETEAKMKAEAEEQAKQIAEAKRLEELETARVAAELKQKADAEEQARKVAEAKRLEELETARVAAELKQKADDEEQARKVAEAKRLEELETARVAAELKQKAEAAEQARKVAGDYSDAKIRAAELEIQNSIVEGRKLKAANAKLVEENTAALKQKADVEDLSRKAEIVPSDDTGTFLTPEEPSTNKTAPILEDPETDEPKWEVSTVAAPEPAAPAPAMPAVLPEAPVAKKHMPSQEKPRHSHVVFKDEPVEEIPSTGEFARLDSTPAAVKNVRSKFIVPKAEPSKPGARAEVVTLSDEENEPAPLPAVVSTPAVETAAESVSLPAEPATIVPEEPVAPQAPAAPPIAPVRKKPVADALDLPTPSGEAPAAFRVKAGATRVRPVDEASGRVTTDEGVLERVTSSPVDGIEYALVLNGLIIHYLTGREQMDLGGFVGQKVQITGTSVVGTGATQSVLEVSSITARE